MSPAVDAIAASSVTVALLIVSAFVVSSAPSTSKSPVPDTDCTRLEDRNVEPSVTSAAALIVTAPSAVVEPTAPPNVRLPDPDVRLRACVPSTVEEKWMFPPPELSVTGPPASV
ncbi:MAG: hypothetical protein ACKORL_06795, partial [Phycisphaerales bacterium]